MWKLCPAELPAVFSGLLPYSAAVRALSRGITSAATLNHGLAGHRQGGMEYRFMTAMQGSSGSIKETSTGGQ
jgi:hypothetical protein